MPVTKYAELDSGLGADSVALLGAPRSRVSPQGQQITEQTAVIGTYELDQQTKQSVSKRNGRLLFVQASRSEIGDTDATAADGASYQFGLDVVGSVDDLPGVLDVTACDVARPGAAALTPVLFAACAENSLRSFDILDAESGKVDVVRDLFRSERRSAVSKSVDVAERIILSVDVVPETDTSLLIAASDSCGGVSLFQQTNGTVRQVESRKNIHSQEVWTTCIDANYSNSSTSPPATLYSGGDDGVLCGWQVGSNDTKFRLRKPHDGVGVTSVAKNRFDTSTSAETSLWTGGYDDMLRLWDVRAMRRCLSELCLGGGVWRLKFHPKVPGLMLAATMYDGFKVVRAEPGSLDLSIVAHYEGHASLAYGATWVPGLDSGDKHVALTGSFYDHSVQLWSVSTV